MYLLRIYVFLYFHWYDYNMIYRLLVIESYHFTGFQQLLNASHPSSKASVSGVFASTPGWRGKLPGREAPVQRKMTGEISSNNSDDPSTWRNNIDVGGSSVTKDTCKKNQLTPWKINMEPTNHPFRKENDLPNLHDEMFHVNLPGCNDQWSQFQWFSLSPLSIWPFELKLEVFFFSQREFQGVVVNGWNQVQLWLLNHHQLFKVHIYWFPPKAFRKFKPWTTA